MCHESDIADSRFRRLALWLFMAGLLLRALIPVGYMANYQASVDGGALIVLCPTGLEGTALYDLLTGGHQHGGHHAAAADDPANVHYDAPCVFAAVAALAATLIALALLFSLWPSIRNRLAPEDDRRPDAGIQLPFSARAPPLPA